MELARDYILRPLLYLIALIPGGLTVDVGESLIKYGDVWHFTEQTSFVGLCGVTVVAIGFSLFSIGGRCVRALLRTMGREYRKEA